MATLCGMHFKWILCPRWRIMKLVNIMSYRLVKLTRPACWAFWNLNEETLGKLNFPHVTMWFDFRILWAGAVLVQKKKTHTNLNWLANICVRWTSSFLSACGHMLRCMRCGSKSLLEFSLRKLKAYVCGSYAHIGSGIFLIEEFCHARRYEIKSWELIWYIYGLLHKISNYKS